MYTCDFYVSGEKHGGNVKGKSSTRGGKEEDVQAIPVDLKVIYPTLLPLIYLPRNPTSLLVAPPATPFLYRQRQAGPKIKE